jgi:hypothetical protein
MLGIGETLRQDRHLKADRAHALVHEFNPANQGGITGNGPGSGKYGCEPLPLAFHFLGFLGLRRRPRA